MESFSHCFRSAAAFWCYKGEEEIGDMPSSPVCTLRFRASELASSALRILSSGCLRLLRPPVFFWRTVCLWEMFCSAWEPFVLTHRSPSCLQLEKDENVKFSRNTWYLLFMPCKHTLTSISSSTGSTHSSALSWNLFTYRSRSSPTHCRVRPSSSRVYQEEFGIESSDHMIPILDHSWFKIEVPGLSSIHQ